MTYEDMIKIAGDGTIHADRVRRGIITWGDFYATWAKGLAAETGCGMMKAQIVIAALHSHGAILLEISIDEIGYEHYRWLWDPDRIAAYFKKVGQPVPKSLAVEEAA